MITRARELILYYYAARTHRVICVLTTLSLYARDGRVIIDTAQYRR